MKKCKILFEETKATITLNGIAVRTYERFPCEEIGRFTRNVIRETNISLR